MGRFDGRREVANVKRIEEAENFTEGESHDREVQLDLGGYTEFVKRDSVVRGGVGSVDERKTCNAAKHRPNLTVKFLFLITGN